MAEFDNRYAAQGSAGTQVGTREGIDAGLRSFMMSVYNYMGLGVAFTAIVTLFVMSNPALLAFSQNFFWLFFVATLAIGWFSPRLILGGNKVVAHAAYWGYAALWGMWIAPMIYSFFALDAGHLVFRAFAIAAVTFGGMSLFGYVTKKNLSAFGSFFVMATIGLLVAIIVNMIFFQSELMSLITSCLVVLVFAGITAWETQEIKQMYAMGDEANSGGGKAIFGAFMLYGSFVVMFIHILNILGIMSND
ncbi:MAG: Bax inhibitor-1/YccA family protein [Hyphomicrobiaceae bacterium]